MGACIFAILKNQPDAPQCLRLVENHPDYLSSRIGRSPTPSLPPQSGFDWITRLLRCHFNRGYAIQVQPNLLGSRISLRNRSNEAFTHFNYRTRWCSWTRARLTSPRRALSNCDRSYSRIACVSSLVLTKLTRTCFVVRSKTKYSPGLAKASRPKRERAVSRSATASKPHGIPTKVRGKKMESRQAHFALSTP